jgi:hypothetical protein
MSRSDDRKGEVLFTAVECCDAYEVWLGWPSCMAKGN